MKQISNCLCCRKLGKYSQTEGYCIDCLIKSFIKLRDVVKRSSHLSRIVTRTLGEESLKTEIKLVINDCNNRLGEINDT